MAASRGLAGRAVALYNASQSGSTLEPELLFPDARVVARELTQWSNFRQRTILPGLMAEYKVTAWVVADEEYSEDTVSWAIWPGYSLRNCSQPAAWVEDLDRACFNDQYDHFSSFTVFLLREEGTFTRNLLRTEAEVAALVGNATEGLAPGPRVVLNNGAGKFQGMLAGSYRGLAKAFGPEFMERYVYDAFKDGAEGDATRHPLALRFIAQRVPSSADPSMRLRYAQLQNMSRSLMRFAASRAVIEPGKTTSDDVNYAMCAIVERKLGLRATSSLAAGVYRKNLGWLTVEPSSQGPPIIQEGDLLRFDWGLKGFGDMLWSDNTMLAFVGTPPPELVLGLQKANRMQGIWLQSCTRCVHNRCTGPEMVAEIEREMAALNWTSGSEGCTACDGAVFSHPIGDFMHSAGPYVETRAKRRPASSDWRTTRFDPDTWFSMELAAYAPWGNLSAEFNLEQNIEITSEGVCQPIGPPLQTSFLGGGSSSGGETG